MDDASIDNIRALQLHVEDILHKNKNQIEKLIENILD